MTDHAHVTLDPHHSAEVARFNSFFMDFFQNLRRAPHTARLAAVSKLTSSCAVPLYGASAAFLLLALTLTGCRNVGFPDTPAGYREYAYVANSGANTVSVLDLVYLRTDRTLQVGSQPTALAVNPERNEVYVVNTTSGTVSVIDAAANRVAFTLPVHRQPTAIAVDSTGHRAYVTNSGSNSISVLDLDLRREIAELPTPAQPGSIALAPDGRSLVVTHASSGTVSVFHAMPFVPPTLTAPVYKPFEALRGIFSGCPGASTPVILPDSSKAFVACSSAHHVMALNLAAAPGTWSAKQNPSLMSDFVLTLLDVGKSPNHIALKPDGGEVFVSNLDSDSVSEIDTQSNQVGGTYMIGTRPTHGIVSRDNSTLYVSNSGADSIGLYSIDDGKLISSLHTGSSPEAMAFSADEHLLLVLDGRSGDVSVIRTQSKLGPNLFTLLPAGALPTAIVTKVIGTRASAH
ncbi:40-residue YVTN family beta-propeller repeat-containing protein [Granulicella pectinivorans]|uniref:40-residue YVTN family beta-propeller repeat-containing protein n=1 Tax=Granulicella pectinivorans TaxID=474950 RepID=A0A1I6M4E8_9BACT|nr:40-residue YVTN family beta-propeller repeat-containing protein [Granulicella pectinivorans]